MIAIKNEYVVSTDDGLSITLRSDGFIEKVNVDGEEYKLKEIERPREEVWGEGSGFFAEDVRRGEASRVAGTLQARDNGFRLRASIDSLDLTLDATFVSRGGYLAVDGELASSAPEPRAVNLYFKLPVSAVDWIWWDDIGTPREIKDGGTYDTENYPFACINSEKAGISIAIPPDQPCIFELGYSPAALFHACFRFGLHPESKLGSRAPFHLIIYRNDPRWGFRHTAKRYYTVFSRFFARRALKNGLIAHKLGSFLDVTPELPAYFAYHVVTNPGHEQGDEKLNIDTFRYINPGQRSDGPRLGEESREVKEEIIKNSVLCDDKGGYVRVVRDIEQDGRVSFVMNPDPDLYSDEDKPTQGRAMIDFSKEFLEENPSFEGIHVDSLWRWGEFYNQRVEHFRYADIPLTYTPKYKELSLGYVHQSVKNEVAIKNEFSLIELLRQLRTFLHEQGRLLSANGVRPGRFFDGVLLDVLEVEACPDLAQCRFYRTCAYQKPFLILCYDYRRETIENCVKRAVLYGLFPSMGKRDYWLNKDYFERDRDLLDLYLPLLKKLSAAGWEPVTQAFSSDREVMVERFGADNGREFYFTAYNPTGTDKETTIEIRIEELGMRRVTRVKELVEGEEMQPSPKINIQMPKLSLRVIQIQGD